MISKSRPDLKEALDNAMRRIAHDKPFYQDDLYQHICLPSRSGSSTESRTGSASIAPSRIGFLNHGFSISSFDNPKPVMLPVFS